MAYKVIILYRLYMPSYFLGTFTEYPYRAIILRRKLDLNTKNKLVDEELGFLNIIKEESGLFNTQKLFLYYYLFYLL